MEDRIHQLYSRLQKGIMPWMWDHDNYMNRNPDMIGFFYDVDINAIAQLEYFESQYQPPKK